MHKLTHLIITASIALSATMTFAGTESTQPVFIKRGVIYSTVNHTVLPLMRNELDTFTGRYCTTSRRNCFEISKDYHITGTFTLKNHKENIKWSAGIAAFGKDKNESCQTIKAMYVINKDANTSNNDPYHYIDSPGVMYLTQCKGANENIMVDIIGHYGNYIALSQRFTRTNSTEAKNYS